MEPTVLGAMISGVIAASVSLLIAGLTGAFKRGRMIGQIEGTVNSLNDRIKQLETRFDGFLLALLSKKEEDPKVKTKLEPFLEKFDRVLDSIAKKGNPLTSSELQKLREYRNKIAHGIPFDRKEYAQFEALIQKLGQEIPQDKRADFDWVVAGLLGFALGLLVAASFSK